MAINPIGSTGSTYTPTNASGVHQRRQNFEQLAQSLKAGDLAGAQKAFAALTQSTPAANVSSSGQGSQSDARSKDIQQLGQSLQSGDLAGAQKAFASLKQDMQAARTDNSGRQIHHHHGHHHALSPELTATASTTPAATAPATTEAANPIGGKLNVSA